MGYPPALIPILGGLSMPRYYGVWHHWFVAREPTFVQMLVWSGHTVWEVARTEEQFATVLAAKAIAESDEMNDEVARFVASVGIDYRAGLEEVMNATGDDPKGFASLASFQTKMPLETLEKYDRYDGSFPVPSRPDLIAQSCSFELNDEFEWDVDIFPVWSDSGRDMRDLFHGSLAQNDLASAWLALNSTGWQMADARAAIMYLAEAAVDARFVRLAQLWCENSRDELGGY